MIVKSGNRKYGFDAFGGEVLKAEDMLYWKDHPMRTDPKGISFELGKEVKEVEADFFSLVPTIHELFILNPECNIIMTEKTVDLFQKNEVLIRGGFDEAAEQFAKTYHLKFLHKDVELAYSGDYYSRSGVNTVTMCFHQDGKAYILNNNFMEGSSSGWAGGGEMTFDLPENFDVMMVANLCFGGCKEEVINNGILRDLLEKTKLKGGFLIDYSNGQEF